MSDDEDSLFVSDADVKKEKLEGQEASESKEEVDVGSEDTPMQDAPAPEPAPPPADMPGDEEDPVVQWFPVYLANSHAGNLHVLQYPTRSVTYPLVDQLGTGVLESRLKPKSDIVEVDVPIDTARFYDQEKGERWSKVDRQTMSGVFKDPKKSDDGSTGSKYMVGIFKNDELHVTPIKSVAQLRPQFKYVDQEAATEKEIVQTVNSEQSKNTKRETRTVQMSAKASGDAAPRYSGALATRKQADEEPFVAMEWYDRDCDDSWREGDKLVATGRSVLHSSTTIDDYITELQK